jgi:hypothetical protein
MRRIAPFVSILVSALSLTTPARKLLDTIFWDWVLQLLGPVAVFFGPYVREYGPALVFLFLGLFLVASERDRTNLYRRIKNVNLWLAGILISALALIGFIAGYYADQSRGKILWVQSTGAPIFFETRSDRPLSVSGFSLIGRSRVDEPLRFREAWIRSLITDRRIDLMVAGVPGMPASPDRVTLQPFGELLLQRNLAAVPTPDQELSLDEFRRQFGSFEFNLVYADGVTFKKTYSTHDVDTLIADAEAFRTKWMIDQAARPGVILNPEK